MTARAVHLCWYLQADETVLYRQLSSQGHGPTRGLYISSREPTRRANCLDSIATSLSSWEYTTDVLDPVIADHCPVVIEVNLDEEGGDATKREYNMGKVIEVSKPC
ncbi:hypothetical protein J6590_060676 [Homalodisca vitripennis]|nr:hypothetical protein J6590_060676 [Homalodisca vitripennis]